MTPEQVERALKAQKLYRAQNAKEGRAEWDVIDYAAGFTADVGQLTKLIMVKANKRGIAGDVDQMLQHEIGDCLWSLIIICSELGITLEDCLEKTLNDLEERLKGVEL